MSLDRQSKEKFRKPEIFFAELLRQSAQGRLLERGVPVPFLRRATVVAVDVVGGLLENPGGTGTVTHVFEGRQIDVSALVGPSNPRNSVKARLLTDGYDQFVSDDRTRVFWPFGPEHMAVPIKPGEHVYVIFEDSEMEHGLWLSKLPGQENVNFFRGQSAFKSKTDGTLASRFSDARGDESDKLNTDLAAGESVISNGRLSDRFGDR